jgi:cysteine-S-conjugate beta-lyase
MLDDLAWEALRSRRSAKWRRYPDDVLPMWIAEMDFPRAEAITAALHAAVDAGDTGYVDPQSASLREAFADFAGRRLGWTVDPGQVRLVPDVNAAIGEVLRLVTDPGDGVAVNTPAYPPFFATIQDLGRTVVPIPMLRREVGWQLNLDRAEQAFANGIRTYLLCNPHNSTGRVFGRAELDPLVALTQRYGVTVVSDEIHAPLTLTGAQHLPWLGLGEHATERGLALTSASKAFDIAGLKCALAVTAHPAMAQALSRLPDEVPYRASILGAIASEAAFRSGDAWLDAVRDQLDRNRRLLANLLAEHLPTVGYIPPEASFLTWLDCSGLGLGDDPAAGFLERGRVALSRGPDFGIEGRGFARLNIGTSPQFIEEAIHRMEAAIRK